jgi:hypothetical protein
MPELVAHPQSRPGPVKRIVASASRTSEGALALSYSIEGDMARVRIASPRPARIGYKLWRHTCCEVFLGMAGNEPYSEFNFSPSGEWAAYAFSGYREGAPLDGEALNPQISAQLSQDRLELSALVDLKALSLKEPKLRVGLAVIVEQQDGGMSFWALAHPPGKPDFHHRAGFVLELP